MKITKIGHCCLVIEVDGVRLMTDPGSWTTQQDTVTDLDAVLITHEHADHFHIDSLKKVLRNNPQATVFTNSGVGAHLTKEQIPFELLEENTNTTIKGISVEGHGHTHADIYPTVPSVINTGYYIADRFFYPGDALYNPQKPVEILALPVVGPWIKIAEAIDYAKAISPKICFPVHDKMLSITGPFHALPQAILSEYNIQFAVIQDSASLTV